MQSYRLHNRDTNRYEFLQANIEDYAQAMTRKYMTYEVLYEDTYCKSESSSGHYDVKTVEKLMISRQHHLPFS